MLLPSAGDLDARARRLAAHADAVRATARRLERDTEAVPWRGTAATAFRAGTADTVRALLGAADRLDEAALALHRHARTVEFVCHGLSVLAVRTGRDVGEVATTLARDAGSVAAGVTRLVGI